MSDVEKDEPTTGGPASMPGVAGRDERNQGGASTPRTGAPASSLSRRVEESSSQGLSGTDAAAQPEPSTGTQMPTEIPVTESVVDMTHWPDPLKWLVYGLMQRGQSYHHEYQDYDIVMGHGKDHLLVTRKDASYPKAVYLVEKDPDPPASV